MEMHVELTGEIQVLVEQGKITMEQWEYYRGGALAQMEVYRILTGKPSAITAILANKELMN